MGDRISSTNGTGVRRRLLSIVRPPPPSPPSPDFASSLVEHLADGVVACDADGNFILLNRRVREGKEGLPQVTLPLKVPIEQWAEQFGLYPPGGDELLTTDELPLVRALRGETVGDMRLETRGNGARAVMNVSGGPVLDANGRIQGAVVVMRDVTEQASAERELRLGSAVAANLAVGVSMVRADDGEIVYANEPWEQLFGYGRGELIGRHISVVNAPTDRTPEERAQEIFDALEQHGSWAGEVHNVRKDGTRLWTACNVSRFEHPEHGSVWISANTDITVHKEEEDTLHHTAERFRTVFEEAPLGMALVSTSDELIDVNGRLCDLVGWRRDELVGRPLARIVHVDDRDSADQLAARVFNGEIPRYRVEQRLLTRYDESLQVTMTATVSRSPDGRPLYWIVTFESG